MVGAIIGAAVSIAGSVAGGVMSARNERRASAARLAGNQKAYDAAMASLAKREHENQTWYERRYNEDATQRADAQRMLTEVGERVKRANRAAAGTAAVMGGTDEAAAAAREQNNQAIADTASQIAADAANRKDRVEDAYRAQQDALEEARAQATVNKELTDADVKANYNTQVSQNVTQAATQAVQAGANMANSLDSMKNNKGVTTQPAKPDMNATNAATATGVNTTTGGVQTVVGGQAVNPQTAQLANGGQLNVGKVQGEGFTVTPDKVQPGIQVDMNAMRKSMQGSINNNNSLGVNRVYQGKGQVVKR